MAKKHLLGIVGIVLVFGIMVVGCEMISDENFGSYTFEFRVENDGGNNAITKIEFINGSSRSDPVLASETIYLYPDEMSNVYRVSGFTKSDGDDKYLFGVLLTFENGEKEFGYNSAADEFQISVEWLGWVKTIIFTDGDW
ncbi:MAG: hypothetical protein LBR47_03930 [Spirochaetaceae bacterium]|jgi:hypothetical protein|nr:hypothetical protein [Spirochaetaceae bacterium]